MVDTDGDKIVDGLEVKNYNTIRSPQTPMVIHAVTEKRSGP